MGTLTLEPPSFYVPLKQPSRQIRLIKLSDPGEAANTTDLCCSLIKTNFDDLARPAYEVLSYCWGDPSQTVPISVNGIVHHITTNLAAALRTIRDLKRTDLPIWADALCINQQDLAEKTCQVNMMASIFSGAHRCLIWLGETYDPLKNPTPHLNSIEEVEALRAFGLIQSLAQDEHYSEWRSGKGHGDLAPLIALPWWNRIWTVQETALPRECVVLCGRLEIPWTTLVAAVRNFQKHHNEMCCARTVSSLKGFRAKVEHIEHAQEGANVGTIFQRFRDRGATDDRDKVFGLLAFSALGMGADYAATLESVFTRTTRKVIAQTGTLKVLLRSREYDRNTALPSWVPDLAAKCDRHRSRELNKWEVWELHNTCAGKKAEMKDGQSEDAPTLTLAGMRIDRIVKIGAACLDLDPLSPQPEGQVSIPLPNKQWWKLTQTHNDSRLDPFSEVEMRAAFMRVLTRDCLEDVAPPSYRPTWRRISPADVEACLSEVRAGRGQRRTFYVSKMINYRFFVTERGLIGVGPAETRVDDAVFILYGGRAPFVLRPDGLSWRFLGDGYVDGIMDGQALDDDKKEWITII